MKRRHWILAAALAVAAGLAIFGDKTPETQVAEPVTRAAAPVRPVVRRAELGQKGEEPAILRLLPRDELIGESEDAFKSAEGKLFGPQNWNPPPPPPPPPAPPPPPPAPTAPPLPFTFIGKSLSAGEWEVYLSSGSRTYLVRDKSVIDGLYRVDSIVPPTLTLTYLPLNQVQQLNIGAFN
jgi:hypothetical protein